MGNSGDCCSDDACGAESSEECDCDRECDVSTAQHHTPEAAANALPNDATVGMLPKWFGIVPPALSLCRVWGRWGRAAGNAWPRLRGPKCVREWRGED